MKMMESRRITSIINSVKQYSNAAPVIKYTLHVSARNNSGFQPSLARKQVWMLHLPSKPGKILLDKKPLSTAYSWDAAKGICSITIPDNGKERIRST